MQYETRKRVDNSRYDHGSTSHTSIKLYEKLEALSAEWDRRLCNANDIDEKWYARRGKEQAMANAIATTPIPSTRTDLFEFLAMAQAAALSPSTPYYSAAAYMTKYNESLTKARLLFSRDEVLSSFIASDKDIQNRYASVHKKQPKESNLRPAVRMTIYFLTFCIVGMVLCYWGLISF